MVERVEAVELAASLANAYDARFAKERTCRLDWEQHPVSASASHSGHQSPENSGFPSKTQKNYEERFLFLRFRLKSA